MLNHANIHSQQLTAARRAVVAGGARARERIHAVCAHAAVLARVRVALIYVCNHKARRKVGVRTINNRVLNHANIHSQQLTAARRAVVAGGARARERIHAVCAHAAVLARVRVALIYVCNQKARMQGGV